MFPYNAQNAIIAKCEADRMDFVEKIINDLDKPAPKCSGRYGDPSQYDFQPAAYRGDRFHRAQLSIAFTPRSSIQVPISSTASTSTATTSTATAVVTPTTTSSTSTAVPSRSPTSGTWPVRTFPLPFPAPCCRR